MHIEYNAPAKLKPLQKCKNEALTKFDIRENILLYSIRCSLHKSGHVVDSLVLFIHDHSKYTFDS